MKRYLLVWAALAMLTTLTVILAGAPLGAWHLPVALTIAAGKSTLVVLFFMHLAEHRHANSLVLSVAVLYVMVMILFSVTDVLLRFPPAMPPS